jgi:hypothetical protein
MFGKSAFISRTNFFQAENLLSDIWLQNFYQEEKHLMTKNAKKCQKSLKTLHILMEFGATTICQILVNGYSQQVLKSLLIVHFLGILKLSQFLINFISLIK